MNQKLKDLIKQNQAEAAVLRRPSRSKAFNMNRFGPLVFLLIFTAAGGAFVYQSGASPLTGATGSAELYVTPSKHQVAVGSELVANVWANSYSHPVNVVQAVVTYPADKMRYVENDASASQFTVQVSADASEGKLVISRSSTQPLTGNQLVAGIVFEPIKTVDSSEIHIDRSSQLLSSDNGQNTLVL